MRIDRSSVMAAKTAEVSTTSATRDGSGVPPGRFRPFFTVVDHTLCSRHSRSTLFSLAT